MPLWALGHVPAAPLLIQLPADCLEQVAEMTQVIGPCSHMDEAPGFGLAYSQLLAVLRGVNMHVGVCVYVFTSLSVTLLSDKIEQIISGN